MLKPRDGGRPNVIDDDLGGSAYGVVGEDGWVGARDGGFCRIRRRPEIPRPCSCSCTTGDLTPASKETRVCSFSGIFPKFESKSPVLRFFGILRAGGAALVLCSFLSFETACRKGAPSKDMSVNALITGMKMAGQHIHAQGPSMDVNLRRTSAVCSQHTIWRSVMSGHAVADVYFWPRTGGPSDSLSKRLLPRPECY